LLASIFVVTVVA